MFKISDYFYTFSYLITSFILLCFLVVLGYALYISYKDVDEVAINLEQKFSDVTKDINLNSAKFLYSRGPDNTSFFFDKRKEFNIGLVHTRLSIIDLNKRANQPFYFVVLEIIR